MILKRLYTMPRLNDPFEEVNRLRRFLDTWSGEPGFSEPSPGVFPLLNVSSNADCYVVRAELPGIKPEELDITVSGNNLTISGERKIPGENKGARYHRKEREAGNFSRAVTLPGPLNPNNVEATLKNGILKVVIHKAEEAKPKKISIR
jgi:HSP20 family protein